MQAVSNAYKQEMKKQLRDHSYMRVSIGLINQEAQASANVPEPEQYTYYSNLTWPLNNYDVSELYETCDQDYSNVDGSMYFFPGSGWMPYSTRGLSQTGSWERWRFGSRCNMISKALPSNLARLIR